MVMQGRPNMAEHGIVLHRSEPIWLERATKSGRKLHYRIQVLQQPEKARACGSGPKSTTDRRPVDPPPVIELRIYEGADRNNANDITFQYNANFFLFCTLEHARVLAHGRVQTPAATSPPVLSGVPVSGMAYLDRPEEAGYFIFPDLSVRHEGRYRFSFHLYEETKEENDMDVMPADFGTVLPAEFAPDAAFNWRMEVKSADFDVYSAKKFPGLSESTDLSRCVAEQGCRVRIRRDVRMRRRDPKPSGKDFEKGEDDYARRRRTETPDIHRARSLSSESLQRTPYGADPPRRPSGADFQPPPPPPSGSYLHQYGAPPYPPTGYSHHGRQTPPVPHSPSFPTGQGAPYPPQPSYPAPPQQQPFGYQEKRSSPAYALIPSPQREEFRRHSLDPLPPPQPRVSGYELAPYTSPQTLQPKEPLPPISLPPLRESMAALSQAPLAAASPTQDTFMARYASKPTSPPALSEPRGAKRARDDLFDHSSDDRLTNFARPKPTDSDMNDGAYRRANGLTGAVPIQNLLNE